MKAASFSSCLEKFFTERLIGQRRASAHTIRFFCEESKKKISQKTSEISSRHELDDFINGFFDLHIGAFKS